MKMRSANLWTTAAMLALAGTVLAQPEAEKKVDAPKDEKSAVKTSPSRTSDVTSGRTAVVDPRWATLNKMMRRITVDLTDTKLEDAMRFVKDTTGTDLEVMWTDDKNTTGLDKDMAITLSVKNVTALSLLEKLLEKAVAGSSSSTANPNTWQLSESGTLQVGPKERLNKWKKLVIYDINDLLFEISDKTNAPTFDLNSAFQSGSGGGGGQSPFQQQGNQQNGPKKSRDEKADEVKKLITELVESEQWIDSGGDGASIKYWNGTFLVNAPDYVHRQIDGYSFWPANQTKATQVAGRRYVSFDGTMQAATPPTFREKEVKAVVPPGGR